MGRWSSQIQTGFHVSGPTWGQFQKRASYAYRAVTFCGLAFQSGSARKLFCNFFAYLRFGRNAPRPQLRNARTLTRNWFGLFPFRSPLLRKSLLLSFPTGTKMCQFPALSSGAYVFSVGYHIDVMGFPIRKSQAITLVGSLPGLIAAYHVLHRLLTPRHPPYTLSNLTTNNRLLGVVEKNR